MITRYYHRFNYVLAIVTSCLILFPCFVKAQVFSDSRWSQKTIIMGKYSPLFYEINVGANLSDRNYTADFLYFSVGYGKPSSGNDWTKFLSQPQQTSNGSKPDQPTEPSAPSQPTGSGRDSQASQPTPPSQPEMPAGGSLSGLHAGMVALGWQHYFNHAIGFHLQAGWGFVADFGSGDDDDSTGVSQGSNSENEESKKTFVYNGVPVQVGIDINMWERLVLQVGTTYMWKEKPYLTLGIGVTF